MPAPAVRILSRGDSGAGGSPSQATVIAIGVVGAAVVVVLSGLLVGFLWYRRRAEALSASWSSYSDISGSPGEPLRSSAPPPLIGFAC